MAICRKEGIMRTFKQIYQESYDEIHPGEMLVEDMQEDARTERGANGCSMRYCGLLR